MKFLAYFLSSIAATCNFEIIKSPTTSNSLNGPIQAYFQYNSERYPVCISSIKNPSLCEPLCILVLFNNYSNLTKFTLKYHEIYHNDTVPTQRYQLKNEEKILIQVNDYCEETALYSSLATQNCWVFD